MASLPVLHSAPDCPPLVSTQPTRMAGKPGEGPAEAPPPFVPSQAVVESFLGSALLTRLLAVTYVRGPTCLCATLLQGWTLLSFGDFSHSSPDDNAAALAWVECTALDCAPLSTFLSWGWTSLVWFGYAAYRRSGHERRVCILRTVDFPIRVVDRNRSYANFVCAKPIGTPLVHPPVW